MLEVNRSDPLREAGPRLPGGKRQSGEISRISRMLGERNALAKRTQAGSVPAWAEPGRSCPPTRERAAPDPPDSTV